MRIAVGSDHAGYEAKEQLKRWLETRGFETDDRGAHGTDPCDYPDFALSVGRAVIEGEAEYPADNWLQRPDLPLRGFT